MVSAGERGTHEDEALAGRAARPEAKVLLELGHRVDARDDGAVEPDVAGHGARDKRHKQVPVQREAAPPGAGVGGARHAERVRALVADVDRRVLVVLGVLL